MTDQTPDFDSMSPEELMAWMESLAKRQGADEGFTTAADMAVPEVDPSTVQVQEPGYIPYGMDADTWKAKQEAEAQRKAERRAASAPAAASAAVPTPAPVVQPVPTPAAPPAPAAAAPQPAASATPDFDSMSPEQLMAWMESLAKRQGADVEQLTTSADMDVPEIDASSVQLEEPGYIPYGMDPDKWAEKQAEEARRKEERRAAAASATPAPRPAAPAPVQQQPAAAAPPLPAAQPELDLFSMDEMAEEESTRLTPAEENPLAWLENLAADGGGASAGAAIPELDLSGLDQPLVPDLSAVGGGQDDPMAWLESLSQGQGAIPGLEQFSLDEVAAPPSPAASAPPPAAVPAAPASDNPLEWLESLARRQGADSEELTTSASLNIPTPDTSLINKGPGYTEYTFESDHTGDDTDALSFLETVDDEVFEVDTFADETEDTSDWLTALASGDVPDMAHHSAASTEDIQSALAQGADIPPDAMKDWMDQMLEQGAARNDVSDYVDEEEDEQIVPAKLPDWLIEQVGAPPEVPTSQINLPSTSPLVDQIVEPPAVDNMPDWLREDMVDGESAEMEDIFAFEDEPLPPAAPPAPAPVAVSHKLDTSELQMDTSDPWVEAFEVERKLGDESVPSWYAKKLASLGQEVPEGPVVSVDLSGDSGVVLMSAELPDESELVAAVPLPVPDWLDVNVAAPAPAPSRRPAPPVVEEPEEPITASVPDWLRDQMPAEQADVFSADLFLDTDEAAEPVAEAASGELPDWLREAGLDTEDEIEIPAWLTETLETNETPAVAAAPPPAPSAPIPTPAPAPVPVAASPAPIVPAVANINVSEMLGQARSTFQAGQFEESVQAYEAVIRANAGLDAVVEDLSGYIKNEAHKSNPALYRVLGDGLMRQGKLQQALDTYRKALNLL